MFFAWATEWGKPPLESSKREGMRLARLKYSEGRERNLTFKSTSIIKLKLHKISPIMKFTKVKYKCVYLNTIILELDMSLKCFLITSRCEAIDSTSLFSKGFT